MPPNCSKLAKPRVLQGLSTCPHSCHLFLMLHSPPFRPSSSAARDSLGPKAPHVTTKCLCSAVQDKLRLLLVAARLTWICRHHPWLPASSLPAGLGHGYLAYFLADGISRCCQDRLCLLALLLLSIITRTVHTASSWVMPCMVVFSLLKCTPLPPVEVSPATLDTSTLS